MATTGGSPEDDRSGLWHQVMAAFALSFASVVAQGLSRFSYALLLPPMRADLAWSYVEAGSLNTANGAGYIAGAVVAAWLARRLGAVRVFIASFAVAVAVLLATAATRDLTLLITLRTLGGLVTAILFILGAGLVGALAPPGNVGRRSMLVAIYVGGAGIGMVVAGVVLPLVLAEGPHRWPKAWIALGLMAAAGLPFAALATRGIAEPPGGNLPTLKLAEVRQLWPTFAGYTCFGAGYVGYMTFIIALLRDQGGSGEETLRFWLVLGAVSTLSTPIWGRFLGHMPNGRGPAVVFAAATLGALPVLVFPGPMAAMVSAVLFGGSFLAGPASITIVAQRQLRPASWTAGIALLTVSFAFAQALGPLLAGAISDATGSIAAGFWVSPALLGLAAAVSLLQRPPRAG